jgi:hypothetical protein
MTEDTLFLIHQFGMVLMVVIHPEYTKHHLLTLALHCFLVIILTLRVMNLVRVRLTGWSTKKIAILANFALKIKSCFQGAPWKNLQMVIFIQTIICYFLYLLFVWHLVRMELWQSKSTISIHVNVPLKATPLLSTVSIPANAISMPVEFRPENASFARGVKSW